ncbi:hypothetical protein Sango_1886800, partial [Sesamum angolense]
GLQICRDKGFRKIWIETDAKAIITLISSPRQGAWNLQNTLQRIRNILSQMTYRISHIFREGNQAADLLANQACSEQQLCIFQENGLRGKVKGEVISTHRRRSQWYSLPYYSMQYRIKPRRGSASALRKVVGTDDSSVVLDTRGHRNQLLCFISIFVELPCFCHPLTIALQPRDKFWQGGTRLLNEGGRKPSSASQQGPKRIDWKSLSKEEVEERLRASEVRQAVPGKMVRRLHSTEIHGPIPARRNGMGYPTYLKVDSLCHKMDEILKILPDLHKNLTDLKTEVADLKRNQRENPETSISRQERIKDALGTVPLLHQRGKAKEISKPKTRD